MRICPSCYGLYGPDQTTCPKDGTATEDSVDILIGKTLDSYQVRALIGEGGMGVVYAGEHTTIGRRVALKVLRPELSLRDDIVERFVQEARAVNTISHGNIVNIYDFGKTPFGSFYIVMEYLDGKNVRSLLDEEGAQPLERVLTVVKGVGAALAAAHGKGFIHRDVKPENIMLVDRAGVTGIKLLDFGIAKLLTPEGGGLTTHTGGALGTPQYMSPEQLEDVSYDHRGDIYSLGAVAYEMLTGRVPYPGKTHAEVRQLQLTRTPPPPSVLRPEVPLSRRLDAAVLWAMSPDPSTRCSQMEDFIDQFQAGFDEAADAPPVSPHAVRQRRTGLTLVIGVALVAMLLGGTAVYFLVPRGEPATARSDAGVDARASAAQLTGEQALALAHKMVNEALTSKDSETRVLVSDLLKRMRRPMTAVQQELRRALAEDSHPSVRRNAALTLARMGDKQATRKLSELLDQPTVQGQTAWDYAEALAMLGDKRGLSRLHRELAGARDLKRNALLRILGRLGDPTARKGLEQALKQPMVAERQFELRGHLAAMGVKKEQKHLAKVATTNEWPVRVMAATALLRSDPEQGKRVLRQALTRTKEGDLLDAAYNLALFRDASSAKILIEFLKSPREQERKESAVALGHLDTPEARKALIKALNDSSREVALAAAVALLPKTGPQ